MLPERDPDPNATEYSPNARPRSRASLRRDSSMSTIGKNSALPSAGADPATMSSGVVGGSEQQRQRARR